MLSGRRRTRSACDVAFYVPSIAPLLALEPMLPAGGAETQILLVARGLAARGARVCVWSYDIPGVGVAREVDGVEVVVREPYRGGRGLPGVYAEMRALRRALAKVDASVVVTRIAGPHVGLIGLWARSARRRFIYSSASIADFDFGARFPSLRDRALYRLGVGLAERVVVQTDEQASLCESRFHRPAVVAKSIAELVPRRAAPEAFLWVGRAAWYKRPLAYVELARAVPEARFRMVAVPDREAGSLLEETRQAAASVPNIELLEPRPRDELMDLIDAAVAVVNTSDFEGMPNVTLEGWARGVPALTLAYDPDGVIERRGLGAFAHGSQEQLAAEARELWQGRHAADELAARCRRYVAEEHSEDAACAAWFAALGLSLPAEPLAAARRAL